MWRLCKPKLTLMLDEYLQTSKLAPATIGLTKRSWEQMVSYCGNVRVNKFSRDLAEGIQSHWQQATSNTTARIYRKSVSPLFSWAVEKGYMKLNPFVGLRLPKITKRQVRVYAKQELKRMLQNCPDLRWLTIIYLALSTGMRKSAIQNLHKNDIDFENGTITPHQKADTESTWPWQPKDRAERILPLASQAAYLLTELLYTIPTAQPYVILKPPRYYHLIEIKRLGFMTDTLRTRPFSNFDRIFARIKKKAGVKGRFHDLRSTCLTDLASVLNPRELMEIAGHSDIETTMRYIGTGRDAVIKARDRVNDALRAVATPSHAL